MNAESLRSRNMLDMFWRCCTCCPVRVQGHSNVEGLAARPASEASCRDLWMNSWGVGGWSVPTLEHPNTLKTLGLDT